MPRMRKYGLLLALAALALPATALALTLRGARRIQRGPRAPMRQSATALGVPEIGTLYPSAGAKQHDCTASVVASPGRNTLMTAAHCVAGRAAGMVFVPEDRTGQAPLGRWTVTGAHVGAGWTRRQDPHEDVAFLTVAPQTINGRVTQIQQVTGAYRLGATALSGQRVTVTGYPEGSNTRPITCTTTIYLTRVYPSFDCHGYVAGTSGSPWVHVTRHGREIVGVIGGLNQGGCLERTSYSSPLVQDVLVAYVRAVAGLDGDDVPAAGRDGCT